MLYISAGYSFWPLLAQIYFFYLSPIALRFSSLPLPCWRGEFRHAGMCPGIHKGGGGGGASSENNWKNEMSD